MMGGHLNPEAWPLGVAVRGTRVPSGERTLFGRQRKIKGSKNVWAWKWGF